MLRVKNLEAGYHRITILRKISLELQEGKSTCIIGPNGAGKSTFLRVISGIIPSISGRIFFGERDITNLPAHKVTELGIVHVPEGRGIFKDMTVNENLTLGLYPAYRRLNKSIREERFKMAQDLFPVLQHRRRQLAGTLSGGEQQMLAIARGLMADPKMLMLDEPSFGLAPLIVESIFGTLSSLMEKAKLTLLIVEQNAIKALSFSTYGYALRVGKIVFEGKSELLLKDELLLHAYISGGAKEGA